MLLYINELINCSLCTDCQCMTEPQEGHPTILVYAKESRIIRVVLYSRLTISSDWIALFSVCSRLSLLVWLFDVAALGGPFSF